MVWIEKRCCKGPSRAAREHAARAWDPGGPNKINDSILGTLLRVLPETINTREKPYEPNIILPCRLQARYLARKPLQSAPKTQIRSVNFLKILNQANPISQSPSNDMIDAQVVASPRRRQTYILIVFLKPQILAPLNEESPISPLCRSKTTVTRCPSRSRPHSNPDCILTFEDILNP